MLSIKNLHVFCEEKEIIKGISLNVKRGEIHALMGPNGAGKTTLALALAGHPKYSFKFQISNFKFQINGKDLFRMKPEERARAGLFVSFQNPIELEGISTLSFLRASYDSVFYQIKIPFPKFKNNIEQVLSKLLFNEDIVKRYFNKGFSGGEKKRMEIVQLLTLKPKFAVLDEIDSGLDVDVLKMVIKLIKNVVHIYDIGLIFITHNPRIFNYLKPDFIHILKDGKIVKSDGVSIIKKIEKEGYGGF